MASADRRERLLPPHPGTPPGPGPSPAARPPLAAMIWAQTTAGVIGDDGGMPWHLPEDFAHLKAMTAGCTLIMGRRTWESLPPAVRPLPGRRSVVITGDPERAREIRAAGAGTATSLAEAFDAVSSKGAPEERDGTAEHTGPVWIFGGASVYAEAIRSGITDTAVITVIDVEVEGDTRAPRLDPAAWPVWTREPEAGWHTAENGLRYRFETRHRAATDEHERTAIA